MITGKEKAWAGTIIGILVTAIGYVAAELADGTAKTVLVVIDGVLAIAGTGLGVYSVPNTPTKETNPQ